MSLGSWKFENRNEFISFIHLAIAERERERNVIQVMEVMTT